MMTIGERIKHIREKESMSQVELAKACNISKQTLYKYENNIVTNIPSDKIELIAKKLNTTPGYLMGWEKTENGTAYYIDTDVDDKPMTREQREKAFESFKKKYDDSIASMSKTYTDWLNDYINSEQFRANFKKIEQLLKKLDDITIENNADDITILIQYFDALNHEGRKEILKRAIELSQIEKYTK